MTTKISILVLAGLLGMASAAERFEAEAAITDVNSVTKMASASASGGFYVDMKSGSLSFNVTTSVAGFYTLWASYFVADLNGKIQNLSVNGASTGQISFPYAQSFTTIKASSKIKLVAGTNTISITHSWGYVNLDYLEITPYVSVPFSIPGTLVSPNASVNAKKMYGFLLENFGKKVVSGVMTSDVMLNDGNNTPMSVANQTEVAWIINASGKTPALIGVDFMHATGKNSEGGWYKDYTNGTLALAENAFSRGGIPAYCWHWKDPSLTVESFYTPGNSSTTTDFNLNKAFSDSTTHAAFNTSSAEYVAMVRDLDIVAGYLKILADKGVPVLWRPLHEASGKWFWWGAKGGAATKALYRLMFDRFTITHGLNNLIWVWTSDEASDALEWYPGDAYVDIVGRDFYYYPREANHGSLASSFEKVKEIFSGKKLVTLSENGSIPHPDSLVSDGAGWSYFMPWYGDYTMDGWAHDNTAADWNSIMNHDYVITLDEMPGWASYVPSPVLAGKRGARNPASDPFGVSTMEIRNIKGERISTMAGQDPFSLKGLARGIYLIRTTNNLGIQVRQVFIK